MSIIDEITRRDAIITEIAHYYLSLALRSKGKRPIPSPDELTAAHAQGGEAWEGILARATRTARPLVNEDGTWTHLVIGDQGEEVVVEAIGLDMLIEASATATAMLGLSRDGHHALTRAAIETSRQYRAVLDRRNAEVLREALAAERGLTD